jgi:hypothetical protein
MSSGDFRGFLWKAAARSVEGVFEEFLDAQINIVRGVRSRASTSQIHLREFLADETDRDETFPRVLSIEDADFLGGSFARHTKNWPLDDIDVYVPLDGMGLVYSIGGWPQPYTVLSDGVLQANPLLVAPWRWMNGGYISSRKVIDGFAKVLSRHYHASKVRRVGEAVNVRLKQGAGEESDGLGFDVVPCFSLKPHNAGAQHIYLIPDGEDGWIRTNPRIDQEFSNDLNRNNGRTLRKAVKLAKWFNTEFLGGRLQSYYIELVVMLAFWRLNQGARPVSTISAATALAFEAVRDAAQLGDHEPLVQGAPQVKRGDITNGDMQRLNQAVERSRQARWYEASGRVTEAIEMWGLVFGDSFPAG